MKNLLLSSIFFTICMSNLHAQCYMERHNLNSLDAWISCETSLTPNPDLPDAAHWIMYDIGVIDTFYKMKIWNFNHWENANYGISSFSLSVSDDGVDWQMVDTFNLAEANASTYYEGEEVSNLDGLTGRYVLLTGVENYGGDCFALSEIRIDLEDNSFCNDKIAMEIVLSPNIIGSSSDIVLITFVVINVGDESLKDIEISVEENLLSGEPYTTTIEPVLQADPNGNGELDVGEVWFYTAVKSYDFNEGDVFIIGGGASGFGDSCQAIAGNAKLLFTSFNPNALMSAEVEMDYREALSSYNSGLNIYPNPVMSGETMILKSDPVLGSKYQILNVNGQVVENIKLGYGQKLYPIETSMLGAGLYFIVPNGNTENKDYPFVITK